VCVCVCVCVCVVRAVARCGLRFVPWGPYGSWLRAQPKGLAQWLTQVVEHLASKCEALSSNPSAAKNKGKGFRV
jgi:hypothetical protein